MRAAMSLVLVGLAAAACSKNEEAPAQTAAVSAEPAAPAPQVSGPKPGKWRMTTQIANMPQPVTVETCVTNTSFAQMQTSQQQAGVTCTEQSFRRDGADFVAHAACTYEGGMKATIDSRFSGDFNSRYTMESKTVMDPAPTPAARENTIKVTAERIGDC